MGINPFFEITKETTDDLLRYATVLIGPADAHDVVAAALVRLAQSQCGVDHVRDLRGYLFRSVANEASSMRRSFQRRRQRERAYVAEVNESGGPSETSIDALRLLQKLPPRQLSVVYLTYWLDLSPQVVSDLLGITEGTVKKTLARGRERLRKELRNE
jgi:RNA polymerase sigma-70 factor (ECF subfamily)